MYYQADNDRFSFSDSLELPGHDGSHFSEAFALPELPMGEGGSNPGAYATTPTSDYQYVAELPASGFGASLDALMSGSKWSSQDTPVAKTIISFSFMNAASTFSYTSMNEFTSSLTPFSETDKVLTRALLAKVEAVCNVDFVEVADNALECGVLRYGYSTQPNTLNYAGYAFFPSSNTMGGDIWIGTQQATSSWDFYRPDLILHETLHAIGLKHPFESGAVLDVNQNIIPNTVMSYSPVAGGTSGWMSSYPATPMPLDIAALQYLYGASTVSNGNTTYDLSSGDFTGFNTVWDAGGTDTLDASKLARAINLDMRDGMQSDIGNVVSAQAKNVSGTMLKTSYANTLSIAPGAVIENAIGTSYADQIGGNDSSNNIAAGGGNDRIEGRGGNDTIDGGSGIDTAVLGSTHWNYTVAKSGAGYTVSGPTGTDTLTSVERLQFTDTRLALDLDGNAGTAAKIIGAVVGSDSVHNPMFMGIGIDALDKGMNAPALMQFAIDVMLGTSHSNYDVANLLVTNVFHFANPELAADLAALLDNGTYTQASLGLLAMQQDANLAHIDFVGLSQSGIEYAI